MNDQAIKLNRSQDASSGATPRRGCPSILYNARRFSTVSTLAYPFQSVVVRKNRSLIKTSDHGETGGGGEKKKGKEIPDVTNRVIGAILQARSRGPAKRRKREREREERKEKRFPEPPSSLVSHRFYESSDRQRASRPRVTRFAGSADTGNGFYKIFKSRQRTDMHPMLNK